MTPARKNIDKKMVHLTQRDLFSQNHEHKAHSSINGFPTIDKNRTEN